MKSLKSDLQGRSEAFNDSGQRCCPVLGGRRDDLLRGGRQVKVTHDRIKLEGVVNGVQLDVPLVRQLAT